MIYFNSEKTKEYIDRFNNSLNKLSDDANKLKGEVNQEMKIINGTIKQYKTEINEFLVNAGFDYKVEFIESGDEYRLILQHKDHDIMVDNVVDHLSYGERNAFALILFMYNSMKNNPDLIILDDPISSFDNNKKYAILNMLFMKSDSKFKKRTILLLTHDLTSIVDMAHARSVQPKPSFHFLTNVDGMLSEKKSTMRISGHIMRSAKHHPIMRNYNHVA